MKHLIWIFAVLLVSCGNAQQDQQSASDSATPIADTSHRLDDTVTTDFRKDSVFTIRFPADSSSVTVTARLNGINKPVIVNIPIAQGNELAVSVVPKDSIANIRINQVFTPDGKADGPYGRSVVKQITQRGQYKVVIAENLMQGEEWKGDFTMTISVK